eukprot:scaffold23257_cov107-Isochrysis_galbana.AAC.1
MIGRGGNGGGSGGGGGSVGGECAGGHAAPARGVGPKPAGVTGRGCGHVNTAPLAVSAAV